MKLIVLFLLCGMLFQGISCNPGEPIVLVANSIDSNLNSGIIDSLAEERDVIRVHPSEFESYKTSTYLVILGGTKAPEGTGDIVDSILTEKERITLQEGGMLVKLNVWHSRQVTIIMAGPEREKTREVFEENTENVSSLLEGIETVVQEGYESLIFLWPSPIGTTDTLAPYAPASLLPETIKLPHVSPYPLKEDVWFFWIDDAPYAKYAHPTRFVLFGIETRVYRIHQEEWWPILNGESLWVDSHQYWDKTYWVHNPGVSKPWSSFIPAVVKYSLPGESHSDRALVVNGWSTGQPYQDMSEDEKGMKEALTKAGMYVEAVNTAAEIRHVLQRWAGEMESSNTLVVYITAHGGRGYFSINSTIFKISELVLLLDTFEKGVHIHVIIDASYAGSSVYPLKLIAEIVITSTSEVTPAYSDLDPDHDFNPGDKGSEFTSGLTASLKELARDETRVEKWKNQAAEYNKSWYIYLLAEAFKTAKELDAGAVMEYTTPVMWIDEPDILVEKPQEQQKESGCSCGK